MAGIPAGVRASDHISLGVIAKTFPPVSERHGSKAVAVLAVLFTLFGIPSVWRCKPSLPTAR